MKKIFTQDDIRKKLEALPLHIRNYINGNEIDRSVQQIGQKYQLHIDQMGMLQTEILDVILQISSPEEFPNEIKEVLGLPEEGAEQITKDVNELIFEKIRNTMRDASFSSQTKPVQTPPVQRPAFSQANNILTQKTVAMAPTPQIPKSSVAIQVPPKLPTHPTIVPVSAAVTPESVSAKHIPPPPHAPAQPSILKPFTVMPLQKQPIVIPESKPTPTPPPMSAPAPVVVPLMTPPTAAPQTPPPPTVYKTDPYKEPVE